MCSAVHLDTRVEESRGNDAVEVRNELESPTEKPAMDVHWDGEREKEIVRVVPTTNQHALAPAVTSNSGGVVQDTP